MRAQHAVVMRVIGLALVAQGHGRAFQDLRSTAKGGGCG